MPIIRSKLQQDIYRNLAVRSLKQIGVTSTQLVKDDWTSFEAVHLDRALMESVNFRLPVTTRIRLNKDIH